MRAEIKAKSRTDQNVRKQLVCTMFLDQINAESPPWVITSSRCIYQKAEIILRPLRKDVG